MTGRTTGSWIVLLLAAVCLTACHRQQAASGSDEGGSRQDSVTIEDIRTMQRLAQEAENAVIAYVKANGINGWTLHDYGWWYKYTYRSSAHEEQSGFVPVSDTCYVIHEQVYDLQGTLLEDAVRELVTHGIDSLDRTCSEPIAYQLMLSEMAPADAVQMVIPWTLAYGRNGSTFVPPCTNVRVLLTMLEQPYTDIELTDDTIVIK